MTRFDIEGFEETDDNLAALVAMADAEELKALGMDALQPVAESARGFVRQRTGRLYRSIAVGDRLSPAQAAQNVPDAGTVEVYVGPGSMAQAITEEFGTVRESGHASMRPGWDGSIGAVVARLRQGASERLRRLAKG